ncbi:DUF4097 family beta strand repeat-containing protein [Dactylosporangium sucinum]|nr:hypothetical protein [Dactylosporangium sucinum]
MGDRVIRQPERVMLDGPVERLEVTIVAGRLNVVATEGPPRVEVTAIGRKPLTVRHDAGTLHVGHPGPALRRRGRLAALFGRRFRTDVAIAVPPQVAAADLTVRYGSVVVSGLKEGASVDVVSGRVTLQGLGGRTAVTIVSGTTEALGLGGELAVAAISGDISIGGSAPHRAEARVISGTITCDLDDPGGADIRLEATSGGIVARIPQDCDLDVHLRAVSGRVTGGFPGLVATDRAGDGSVAGVLGTGAGRLRAVVVSGDVALLARSSQDHPGVAR